MKHDMYIHQYGEEDQAHRLPQVRVCNNRLNVDKPESKRQDEVKGPFSEGFWSGILFPENS
jgi:hypothetical protein